MSDTITPLIGNLPGADLPVIMPNGRTINVNMVVLCAEKLMAGQMAGMGFCQAQNMPTIKKLNEKYDLEYYFDGPVRTWKDCAAVLEHIHDYFQQHIDSMQNMQED